MISTHRDSTHVWVARRQTTALCRPVAAGQRRLHWGVGWQRATTAKLRRALFAALALSATLLSPSEVQAAVHSSDDIPVNILDEASAFSTLSVTGETESFGEAKLSLEIAHTWRGDLDIYLSNESGTEILVFAPDPDDSSEDVILQNQVVSFDQAIVPNGLWTLEIIDFEAGDTGQLLSWSLNFANQSATPLEEVQGVKDEFDSEESSFGDSAQKSVAKTYDLLASSVAPPVWDGDSHLQLEGGKSFFKNVSKATKEMAKLAKSAVSGLRVKLADWRTRLVETAKDLAQAMLDRAAEVGGKLLENLTKSFEKAQVAADDGKADKAIKLFGKVWEKAVKGGIDASPPPPEFSDGIVSISGVSESAFNATSSIVRFNVAGAFFTEDPEDIYLFNDPDPPASASVDLQPTQISVTSILNDGINSISLLTKDNQGGDIEKEVILWAGSNVLDGTIVDENGDPVSGISITAKLGDDQTVQESTTSVNGTFEFADLPGRTIIIEAFDPNDTTRIATVAANGSQGTVHMVLSSMELPSPIDNNDFSLGTDGWKVGDSPMDIVPHEEELASLLGVTDQPVNSTIDSSGGVVPRQKGFTQQYSPAGENATIIAAADTNMDLELHTAGEGPQKISRTFNTKAGTRNVTVRYRFITSEIPGGYFGTQYNDYFNVSLRCLSSGQVQSESASMNGLGLAAFSSSGATAWREKDIKVNPAGDTVQVDLTVANVADGALDSKLVVDLVDEKGLAITTLQLNDIDNSKLELLSTASHSYFGGNTRVHGTITVEGAENDALESLKLEVIQGGVVVAVADLAQQAAAVLSVPFGADSKVEIAASQWLFSLPSSEASKVSGTVDGTLSLRVRAMTTSGEQAMKDAGSVKLLVQFTGTKRYLERNVLEGGDDWVQPSLKKIADHFDLTYGDFSNMNGGYISPHTEHRTGYDVDVDYDGYDVRDANTASTILSHLNDPTYGKKIQKVYVTFERTDTDPFWNAIKDVELSDTRMAKDVIVRKNKHEGHFHWSID